MAGLGQVFAVVLLVVGACTAMTGLYMLFTDGGLRSQEGQAARSLRGLIFLGGGIGQLAAGVVVGLLAQIADRLDHMGGLVQQIEKRQADAEWEAKFPSKPQTNRS